jgi:hypothetical protein
VDDELRTDPDIDATDIGIAVKDGVVELQGSFAVFVRSATLRKTSSASRP